MRFKTCDAEQRGIPRSLAEAEEHCQDRVPKIFWLDVHAFQCWTAKFGFAADILGDAFVLDLGSLVWTEITHSFQGTPSNRYGHRMAVANSAVYLHAGFGNMNSGTACL